MKNFRINPYFIAIIIAVTTLILSSCGKNNDIQPQGTSVQIGVQKGPNGTTVQIGVGVTFGTSPAYAPNYGVPVYSNYPQMSNVVEVLGANASKYGSTATIAVTAPNGQLVTINLPVRAIDEYDGGVALATDINTRIMVNQLNYKPTFVIASMYNSNIYYDISSLY